MVTAGVSCLPVSTTLVFLVQEVHVGVRNVIRMGGALRQLANTFIFSGPTFIIAVVLIIGL
jgi:hypothetical protein